MRLTILIGLVLICSTVTGQTGPGGVGSSSDLELWLLSNTQVFSDGGVTAAGNGDGVAQWNDQSENGNNVSQGTATNQPTLNTNQLNGFPTVTFDGSNDYMDRLLSTGSYATTSVFIVGQFAQASQGSNDHDFMFCLGNLHTDLTNISRGKTSQSNVANKYFSYTEGAFLPSSTTISNGHSIFSQRFNSSSVFHHMAVNGAALTVQNSSSGPSVGRNIRLGAMFVGATNAPHNLNGDLVEVIFYDIFVNTTQRVIVDNYLAAKYGLTLDANSKYAFGAAHGNDVAGIGQESATDNHTSAQGASIVLINNPDDLGDGEYLLWGHDNAGTGNGNSENPTTFGASGLKLNQEWRADLSGGDGLGSVDITFDMTGITFGANSANYVIITDPDGAFNDGDETVHAIAPSINGNLITFESVPLADGDFFTIANDGDIEDCFSTFTGLWTGGITWFCGTSPPDSTVNGTISDGTAVTVADTRSINDLIIDEDAGGGGGQLILNNNTTLIVTGNLTIGSMASITMGSGSRLVMRGTAAQTITNNSGSALTVTNLTISNDQDVTLAGGNLEISDGLTLTNGDLVNGTSITFLSDATSTGHVNAIPNGSTITGAGTINVERFRGARNANWGDIASSGVDTDIEDLDGEIFISGIPGGDGYAGAAGGGAFISFYSWDEDADDYVAPASTDDPFELGRGYEVWLADDINDWNAQAWSLSGDLNLSTIQISVNSNGTGWNLLGNPYPGYLDWDNITANSAGITDDAYWYLNANTNSFVSVAAGGGAFIAPGQGFWVLTNAINTIELDPSEDLLSDQNTSTLLKRHRDELHVYLKNEAEPYASSAYMRVDDMAFVGKDARDISPLRVPDPKSCQVSFASGADRSMVNYVPTNESALEIPLTVESGMAGDYTLNISGLNAFDKYQCATLIDEETGERIPLSEDQTYTFNISQIDAEKRFTLLMLQEDNVDCYPASGAASSEIFKVWNTSDDVVVDFYFDRSTNASVTIYNSLGEPVMNHSNNVSYSRDRIDIRSLSKGVYFVKVSANGYSSTEKVILN